MGIVIVLATFFCVLDEFIHADDAIFEQPGIRAAIGRIAKPLDRVFHIARHQFAAFAFEDRIVRKQNAGLDTKREQRAALLAFRYGLDYLRCELCRSGQPIVSQQGFENILHDADRIAIFDALRIKAGLSRAERHFQDFLLGGGGDGWQEENDSEYEREEMRVAVWPSLAPSKNHTSSHFPRDIDSRLAPSPVAGRWSQSFVQMVAVTWTGIRNFQSILGEIQPQKTTRDYTVPHSQTRPLIRAPLTLINIQIQPRCIQNWMFDVPHHPRMHNIAADTMGLRNPGCIRRDKFVHLVIDRRAFQ